MAAFLVALPYVLYQAWAFVAPGLYAHEKRLVLPLVVAAPRCSSWAWRSATSSSSGWCSDIRLQDRAAEHHVAPDIENYLNFVLTMFLAFGVTFEVPVAV